MTGARDGVRASLPAALAPVIWLATSGRDPSEPRRLTVALLAGGLRPSLELTLAEVGRHAANDGHPDVVVLACNLIEDERKLVRQLAQLMPSTHTVVVSPIDHPVAVRRALDMGANGVVDARRLDQTLAIAVRAVNTGLLALPLVARSSAEKPILSHREKRALALVVEGLTNGEIASRLGLSQSTIKSHLASAFAKLGVRSRTEAAALILDPDSGLAEAALPPGRDIFSNPGALG